MKLTDEQKEFANENINLLYGYMRKKNIDFDHVDDLFGLLSCEYCTAVSTYQPNKGKFSTYAYNIFDKAMFSYYRSKNYHVRKINDDEMLSLDSKANSENEDGDTWLDLKKDEKVDVENEAINLMLVNEIFSIATSTQKKYLKAFYSGMSKADIGRVFNVSKNVMHETLKQVRKRAVEYNITWNDLE